MMQPSILGPPPPPFGSSASASRARPAGTGAGASTSAGSAAAATAAVVSFIPERAPTFARQNTTTTTTTAARSRTTITAANNHHAPSRSTGSDFIHVDRSNNRRMAAPPSDRVDSWIEVGSQPSDSYTSSSSPEDPVQAQTRKHRTRRRRNSTSTAIPAASRAVDSSDEYDDDDEELDGIDLNAIESMGSSITDPSLSEGESGSSDEDDEDEDDEGEIQPVAGLSSYTSAPQRPQNNFRTFSRDPPQPDHDAALRASLSTLLSCAAGVGSASKPRQNERMGAIQEHARPAPIQTLSLVTDSEREAMMSAPRPPQPPYRRTVHHPPPPQNPSDQKRPVSPGRSREDTQNTKHKSKTRTRRSSKTTAAPAVPITSISASNMTYLTLAVSAGAVIIVSAISFSAGYALGKEIGRSEMLELGSSSGDIVKRAASGTVGKVGGKIVMSSGMGSGLRSITVS